MDSYMRIINNLIQNVIAHSHADKIKIALSKQGNPVSYTHLFPFVMYEEEEQVILDNLQTFPIAEWKAHL